MSVTQLFAVLLTIATPVTATAPATRAPVVAPANSHCPQWHALALSAGWRAEQWQTLDDIMHCESRCDPSAHNRSGASGLLQIMPMHWHGRNPYDPAINLMIGHEVYGAQGWRAWQCY